LRWGLGVHLPIQVQCFESFLTLSVAIALPLQSFTFLLLFLLEWNSYEFTIIFGVCGAIERFGNNGVRFSKISE